MLAITGVILLIQQHEIFSDLFLGGGLLYRIIQDLLHVDCVRIYIVLIVCQYH